MPLYQDNGLEGGRRQEELAALPLPGPAVVIDVRQSVDEDAGELLWYLAIELEDLSMEMRLNHIHHWRYLAQCIDFLKLDVVPRGASVSTWSDFAITTRTDQGIPFLGRDDLAMFIGSRFIDRVRNNRSSAIEDTGNQVTDMDLERASPEQSTVHVFFLTDLEDEDSLQRAAIYADWLKEWSNTYNGPTRTGREELIQTIAVCMNANLHHHSSLLRKVGESHTGLDTVLLIETYRDDDVFIGGNAQLHQAELLLYTLLLYWPQSLETNRWKTVNDPDSLPWPTYIVGTSSLEYSARWGVRWHDYGLAAKAIEILRDWQNAEDEENQAQFEVQKWWEDWWQRLKATVPDTLIPTIPDLQVFDQIQGLIRSLRSQSNSLDSSAQNLVEFGLQMSQLYTGKSGMTLQRAMESASHIPWQLKRAAESNGDYTPYKDLTILYIDAQLFLVSLFHTARGAIPRALHQLDALTNAATSLRVIEQNPPNLRQQRQEFEDEVKLAQIQLEHLRQRRHWPWRKPAQSEIEPIYDRLFQTIQRHIDAIRVVIAARTALTLLQWVDLYNPTGGISPYQLRLKQVDEALKAAQERALEQQEIADRRLKLSLWQAQESISDVWLPLNSRKELLQWDQITEAFLQACKDLESFSALSDFLGLLAETILRRLGTEKLSGHDQRKIRRLPPDQEQERLQVLSTLLVGSLLSAKTGGEDITAAMPLLTQYKQLQSRERYLPGPAVLESDALDVQPMINKALLEQARRGISGGNRGRTRFAVQRTPPIEHMLATWIGNQVGNVSLAEALDNSGILARLEKQKVDVSKIIEAFGRKNTLLGHTDIIAGTDHFYLLLAPNDRVDTPLFDTTQLKPAHFPDAEKLVYLHIHRIRQLPSDPFIHEEG